MLSESNIKQLKIQGKDIEKVESQIQNFANGFPFMQLNRAATIGDGIIRLSEEELKKAVDFYDNTLGDFEIIKFVPASGAASRMFKDLFSFMNEYRGTPEDMVKFREEGAWKSVKIFFDNVDRFAFYEDLKTTIGKDGLNLSDLIAEGKYHIIIQYVLTEKGLNYGNLPKGLLKFHKYEPGPRLRSIL